MNLPAKAHFMSLLLLGTMVAGGSRAEQPVPVGNAIRGKQLYFEHGCYGCHGYNGQTGARNLVGNGSPIVENVDLFLLFLRLRADVAPPFPVTSMPNYAETALGDSAARDIFAYISSFRLDAAPAADIPALRAIVDSARRPRNTN